LICGGIFFTAGVVYILFSSHIAALAAATVPDLASIERFKGLLFIVFTTLLLFFIIYAMLLRINRQQGRLLNFGNRLIAAERRAAALVVADSAAREIGNLLMTLEYYIQELPDTACNEKSDALQRVKTAQARLKRLAKSLAAVTGRKTKKEYFDLAAAVKDAISFAGKHRNFSYCKVSLRGLEQVMFMGNLLLVYQMILNLYFENIIQLMSIFRTYSPKYGSELRKDCLCQLNTYLPYVNTIGFANSGMKIAEIFISHRIKLSSKQIN
jgi:hypothetical protein